MISSEVRTIEWRDGRVIMIDQRLLPAVETYVTCSTWEEVAEAISTMVIRGAPRHWGGGGDGRCLGGAHGGVHRIGCGSCHVFGPPGCNQRPLCDPPHCP